jgi:hypothetical protein
MPEPDAQGNYPAVEALWVSLALKIIRHRRRVGLSQIELARRAGVRPKENWVQETYGLCGWKGDPEELRRLGWLRISILRTA